MATSISEAATFKVHNYNDSTDWITFFVLEKLTGPRTIDRYSRGKPEVLCHITVYVYIHSLP